MGLISGPPGETVFSEPVLRYFRHNPLPELLRKTEKLEDERLLAIVTALIVEDRLDTALESFIPKYKRLLEKGDFTFSVKIALLESLALVPVRITRAADVIRRVRNEFAHHLEFERLDQLKEGLLRDIKGLRSAVHAQFGPEDARPRASMLEEFKSLSFFVILGLDAYSENLAYLRKRIASEEFVRDLYTSVGRENEAEMQAVLTKGPVSVEVRDGQRIERYEKGVVQISVADAALGTDSDAVEKD